MGCRYSVVRMLGGNESEVGKDVEMGEGQDEGSG